MKIELHILQNFAPSNLNRDDTGAPKDCELGGWRRARISSQCQKRAVREQFRLDGLLAHDELATRTKRLAHQVTQRLVEEHQVDPEVASQLAIGAIEGVGFGRNTKGEGEDLWKTEYLLFVPRRVVHELARLIAANQEKLMGLVGEPDDGGKKKGKKSKKDAYDNEVRKEVEGLFEDARGAVDLALFGRMIADKPKWNVDAACQVAHAISTNRLQSDFDFFTAVDDFKPDDTAGSDMMGTVQFNSSCYYRYAVLDVKSLRENLQVDDADELVSKSIGAFVRAFVSAIPTGKQNSMAAHNFPSYVLAVVRNGGQALSMTNAFLKPARPNEDRDLVDESVSKLEGYFGRLADVRGPSFAMSWADRDLADADGVLRAARLNELFDQVASRASEATS